MYAYKDADDPVDSYQRSVRERANQSLHELEDVLTQSPGASLNTSIKAKEQLAAAVQPRSLRWYEGEARPQKYKDAVSSLQTLLKDPGPQSPVSASPTDKPFVPQGPLPTPEEAVTILQQQANYVQQLESENRYMKDEFANVRVKIKDVLDENQRLHEELKKSVMEEILTDDILKSATDGERLRDSLDGSMTQGHLRQWQLELEKLSALHAAKTERLESQLAHTREEVQKYEEIVEGLRSQIRVHEAIPTHEDGVSGLYLSDTQRGFHQQTIDRLSRERDDLMAHVASLKVKVTEMSHREDDAYQQIRKGIELVEQSQLEQTQAMVQREQLAEELNNMKQRFDVHIQNTQHKISEEREIVHAECKAVIDQLNTKVSEANEQRVAAQNEMDKALRDKVALINDLEVAKQHIKQYDKEVSMATENFNAESTNAKIQKSQAVNEAQRLRADLDSLRREKDQERSRLQSEVDDFRRRLIKAERDLVNSKEECIHLTTTSQALQRELHLAKLARDSVERGRSEDLKVMSKRSAAREEELGSFITSLEDQHGHTTSEMDTMLAKQNKLIGKLKGECRKQAQQIEAIMKKNRSESGKLRRHNEEFRARLQRTSARLKDHEDQAQQHVRVQEKMTERLKMMDDHSQHQGTQILELITKQANLLRDRTLLARELEFLRRHISRNNQEELNKFVSSNKLLVDEVLDNVRVEDAEKKDTYILKPKENIGISDLIY